MLLFLMPAEVSRSFMLPPRVITAGEPFGPRADPYALETRRPPRTHRLPPDPALGLRRLIVRRVLIPDCLSSDSTLGQRSGCSLGLQERPERRPRCMRSS